jgi:hypothetical protein
VPRLGTDRSDFEEPIATGRRSAPRCRKFSPRHQPARYLGPSTRQHDPSCAAPRRKTLPKLAGSTRRGWRRDLGVELWNGFSWCAPILLEPRDRIRRAPCDSAVLSVSNESPGNSRRAITCQGRLQRRLHSRPQFLRLHDGDFRPLRENPELEVPTVVDGHSEHVAILRPKRQPLIG